MSGLLTVADVVGLLRLSRSALYAAVERGQIPAIRLGRRLRFRATDIARLVERGTQPDRKTARG